MSITRRTFLSSSAAVMAAGAFPLDALAGEAVTVSGGVMGTTWLAVVPPACDAATCADIVGGVLAAADALFSPWRSDSPLSRMNGAAGDMLVPRPLATVVAAGLDIAARSGGAFNPAIGGIVARYGFGPIRDRGTTAWSDLAVDGLTIAKADPAVTFDPCGIAKGHALDMAADALAAEGYRDILIELGGEIVARGRHPQGRAWRLAVERPDPAHPGIQRVVTPADGALATSGDTVNTYTVAGRRYHHIIDPRTSEPATGLASVSVVAATGLEADAWATALMAMGPEAGPTFAETHGLAALFVARETDGLREVVSPAMSRHIVT